MLVVIFICYTINLNAKNDEPIILESKLIPLIDGQVWGFDGIGVGLSLQIRRDINNILFGTKSSTGLMQGKYTFDGKQYSINELAMIEKDLEETLQNTCAPKITRKQAELTKLLKEAKNDFEVIVGPFLENARNAKEFMVPLIQEACTKRKRENSILLEWAQEHGKNAEATIFNKYTVSFETLRLFCLDLTNLLEDLIRSCPKAREQFKKLAQNKKNTDT
jgi:hypothetical protein